MQYFIKFCQKSDILEVEIESKFFEVSMIEFFDTLKRIKGLKTKNKNQM